MAAGPVDESICLSQNAAANQDFLWAGDTILRNPALAESLTDVLARSHKKVVLHSNKMRDTFRTKAIAREFRHVDSQQRGHEGAHCVLVVA